MVTVSSFLAVGIYLFLNSYITSDLTVPAITFFATLIALDVVLVVTPVTFPL
jgi:hypothetical protein